MAPFSAHSRYIRSHFFIFSFFAVVCVLAEKRTLTTINWNAPKRRANKEVSTTWRRQRRLPAQHRYTVGPTSLFCCLLLFFFSLLLFFFRRVGGGGVAVSRWPNGLLRPLINFGQLFLTWLAPLEPFVDLNPTEYTAHQEDVGQGID